MFNQCYKKLKEENKTNCDLPQTKAKYKNKYYPCKILERYEHTSKVLFITSKYVTTVNNSDITYQY